MPKYTLIKNIKDTKKLELRTLVEIPQDPFRDKGVFIGRTSENEILIYSRDGEYVCVNYLWSDPETGNFPSQGIRGANFSYLPDFKEGKKINKILLKAGI